MCGMCLLDSHCWNQPIITSVSARCMPPWALQVSCRVRRTWVMRAMALRLAIDLYDESSHCSLNFRSAINDWDGQLSQDTN